jgi:uncharacterized membrane protein
MKFFGIISVLFGIGILRPRGSDCRTGDLDSKRWSVGSADSGRGALRSHALNNEESLMSKFVVAIFSDEAAADMAAHKLNKWGDEGKPLFESLAIVVRNAEGKLSVRDTVKGASAAAAGALIGAVAGFPAGGPAAAVLAATAGALVGFSADLLNRGADIDFIKKIARELSPGKVAIVAEVPEDRMGEFYARTCLLAAS